MLYCLAKLETMNKFTVLDGGINRQVLSKDPDFIENGVMLYKLIIISPKQSVNAELFIAIDDMAHFTRPYFAQSGDKVYIKDSNGNPLEAEIKGVYWHNLVDALVVAVGDGGDNIYDTWEVWDFSNHIQFRAI